MTGNKHTVNKVMNSLKIIIWGGGEGRSFQNKDPVS